MGPLRWIAKAANVGRKWWLGRKEWNYEELTEPLMDEISTAAGGNFPGSPGDRESIWEEEIPTAAKDRAPDSLNETADDYISSLSDLETLEEKRVSLAERFIDELPDGQIQDTQVLFLREVHEHPSQHHHPHSTAERGDFDQWLLDSWTAFEKSEDPSQLSTEIEAIARSQDRTAVDIDAIRYWEEERSNQQWAETFWDLYEGGLLRSYHQTLQDIDRCKSDLKAHAREMDELLRVLN